MDDMTALDRLLTSEVRREAGPSQPVNDAAIFTAITATQSPKWRFGSMFSATKFVVAGAIVALFGGFLLSGVLTQPSEEAVAPVGASATPATETDLSPQAELDLEEVSPGVYLVQGDGANQLTEIHDVHVTPDSDAWVVRRESVSERARSAPEYTVFRLTDPEPALQHRDSGKWWLSSAADGSLVVRGIENPTPISDELSRGSVYRDGAWVPYAPPASYCESIRRALQERPTSDGEHCWDIVPLSLRDANRLKGVDGWSRLLRVPLGEEPFRSEGHVVDPVSVGLTSDHLFTQVDVADDGTVWASYARLEDVKNDIDPDAPEPRDSVWHLFEGMLRYDGESWTDVPFEASGSVPDAWPSDLAVGPDGTVWVSRQHGDDLISAVSWDGSHWSHLGPIEFPSAGSDSATHFLDDGRIWFFDGGLELANGVLRRTDLPAGPLVVGPDGRAWKGSQKSGGHLYLIQPEAVAE